MNQDRSIGEMVLGLEGYSYTTALGRKRVVLSNYVSVPSLNSSSVTTPSKRMCSEKKNCNDESGRSRLEALPRDILIKVLCGVDHEDLEQLVHVSQTIREATQIARRMHFEYSTPKKKIFALRPPFGSSGVESIEPPNAPLGKRKSRLSGKHLGGISMALFPSTDEEQGQGKGPTDE
ncbi:hypothetical protein Fmac_005244 [Flemingia macrophylla]|uniref:F-box domain-containing protein n=1 Tax=Flemingia macrophylla TaxID=520843 RepID=A0ABD1N776_9FABA